MRLLKPEWVKHEDHPIFSIDIHPDGSRFATGGQGDGTGKVVVWNMAPVREEKEEENDSVPKILCQMDNHLSCVNCVRWSNKGKFLASGGDDKVIMVWQTSRYSGPSAVFGSGGSRVNVEQWRCIATLRGHTGDVLDLNWSPHDEWLATCSVDNKVIVWNMLKVPEQIAVLKGHTGMVKGVTWDPVGKYLASQADDKTLRVWRTQDWQQETSVTEPFQECCGTTHVLRLSWSPDGQYIVSAHAMNNSGPTAQIIERNDWRANLDFVGHRKAITVVRFNPNILCKKIKKNADKPQQYSCCAIGSRDRALSVWLTALKRPLVVVHDLFTNSILDISWGPGGFELMCCSGDGTVAYIEFSQDEIGTPLTKAEMAALHKRTYGRSLAINDSSFTTSQVIETTAMLNLQQTQKDAENTPNQQEPLPPTPKKTTVNGGTPVKHMPNKQIETRTKDGKRRITPIFLAPQPDLGEAPLPFGVVSNILSTSTTEHSRIIVETQESAPAISHARMKDMDPGTMLGHPQMSSSPIKEAVTSQEKQQSQTPASQEKKEPPSQSGVEASAAAPRPLEKDIQKEKTPIKLTLKRKAPEPEKPDKPPEVVVVRKRGRPPKNRDAAQSPRVVTQTPAAVAQPQEKLAVSASEEEVVHERVVHAVSGLQLPVASIDGSETIQVSGRAGTTTSVVLQVKNGITAGQVTLHKLECLQAGQLAWEAAITSKILAVASSGDYTCAACDDNSIVIFSASGCRLGLNLVLDSKVSILHCSNHYVMAITSKGSTFVWNTKIPSAVIKNEPLSAIIPDKDVKISKSMLTDQGVPVLTLSNSKVYTFQTELGCWALLCDKSDKVFMHSDHHSCMTPQDSRLQGTLARLQDYKQRGGNQANRIFQSKATNQQSLTLSHLEQQVAASLTLKSASEYKAWLMTFVRYIVQEGLEAKVKEVCEELLGPLFKSRSQSTWEPRVLGFCKRALLKEVLQVIGTNLKFQRLFTEYQEQLELAR